ncbi:zygote arrest protein 1 [Notamacropus eugenii]|uniref:zygote arrest protein 1 n=1 Tax=Notamacropus eugenii TaxID=9315 RepID=UPI003B67D190
MEAALSRATSQPGGLTRGVGGRPSVLRLGRPRRAGYLGRGLGAVARAAHMAALAEDGMDGFKYAAYSPYSFPYVPGPEGSGRGGWRPRAGAAFSLGGCGQLTAAKYFDSYQRAQLMAVLSQMSPGLVPRFRKTNTRDVAVQVNPLQDASVQCSLGRRTLVRRGREPGDPAPPRAASPPPPQPPRPPAQGSPGAPRPARFPRTVAVYSPMASRRLATFEEEAEVGEAAGHETRLPSREAPEAVARSEHEPEPREGAADVPRPEPREDGGGQAQAAERGSSEDQLPRPEGQKVGEEEQEEEEDEKEEEEEEEAQAQAPQPQSPGQNKMRLRFQFLEQKYGYYHCKDCNIRWESAYVWCVQGTNKVYFKQFCRTCQKSYNPYRVEDIACQNCKETRCSCPVKLRHVDPKRPHRQDLCGRCKGKRLSCDSTFSFKYII